MPAPSPMRGSAPTAPRCSRLHRMRSPSSTIRCDLRPLMSAMNPTPQESLSSAGSYSPCASGVPGSAVDPRNGVSSRKLGAASRLIIPALCFRSLISSCLAGAARGLRRTHLVRSAQRPCGPRTTALEEGQPCPVSCRRGCSRWAPPMSAPPGRPPPWPPLLGQQCCPNRPCQILHRHTRLVHAGMAGTFRFVAAAPRQQARRGPRAPRSRNAVARAAIAETPARLTV